MINKYVKFIIIRKMQKHVEEAVTLYVQNVPYENLIKCLGKIFWKQENTLFKLRYSSLLSFHTTVT